MQIALLKQQKKLIQSTSKKALMLAGVGYGKSFIGAHFVWLTIPFSIIVSWVFHTMERIGRVGENPFEGTANDIPITTMSRGIEIDLREMLDEPSDSIPKPIESKFNIQM